MMNLLVTGKVVANVKIPNIAHSRNLGCDLFLGPPPPGVLFLELFATPTLGSDKPPGSWWWKKVARGENGGGGDGWEDRVTPVRVFNTITSQYETLQTYSDHYRFLTETRSTRAHNLVLAMNAKARHSTNARRTRGSSNRLQWTSLL